ncbi:MAG: lipoprotein ABC transporter ATP-binding protein [Coxiella sp. RIFCSPHIGHO2_12_FULL_44_14]|nr:MAG: lipoprotein ABC transporter ATP-binding protein [Coxiella sp. RIFCSPHIGHO2_12_FULL_44_14]
MNDEVAVRCSNLTKTFTEGHLHIPVLRDVNFSVSLGERVAIVGASGAGKSTLLQLLGGLDSPSSGDVFIAGHNVVTLTETAKARLRNRYLGFVYQFHHLLPEFNALENVCIPLLIRRTPPAIAKEKALEYLKKVGLEERQQHRIGELSGGERQRVAIARALVTEPHCVLADELTGNLDQTTAEHIGDLILQLNQQLKTSFVIVTHNRSLAEKMDRILILEKGSLHDLNSE